MTQFTIGVDISKAHLDVYRLPDKASRRFTNDKAGLKALVKWLGEEPVERIVFEATGRYHRHFQRAMANAGFPLSKVNPRQARRFAEACGQLAKTDRLDAQMLAKLGELLKPVLYTPISQELEEMRELFMARRALIKDQTAAQNRSEGLMTALAKRQNRNRLKQIERDIKAIDADLLARVKADAVLKTRFDILVSIPSIGKHSALSLLIDMPELGTLDSKQAAALVGLAPMARQSGGWQGRTPIRGGRTDLRHDLYMPAVSAIRWNPDLKIKFNRLIAAGKPAKVALTALMRNLVVLANALLRKGTLWQPFTA